MRRQHTGREGAVVIGDDWSAGHRAAATRTHTAACTVRHPGGARGAVDPTTGARAITPNAPHFTGPCSVSSTTSVTTPEAAEETVPTTSYLVGLDWDAATGAVVGDIVTITTAGPNGDPTLPGVELVVDAVSHEYLAWERILRCSENQS